MKAFPVRMQKQLRKRLPMAHFGPWKVTLWSHDLVVSGARAADCRYNTAPTGISVTHEPSGGKWEILADSEERLLKKDGTPISIAEKIVSRQAKPKGNTYIDFWHYALGLDGSILKGRETTISVSEYFHNFELAISGNTPFTQALKVKTDNSGFVLFDSGDGGSIPLPSQVKEVKHRPRGNRDILITAERVLGKTMVFMFDARTKNYLGEIEYNPEHRLFFYHSERGNRVFFTSLRRRNGIFESELPGLLLKFVGCNRHEGETMRVAVNDDRKIVKIKPGKSVSYCTPMPRRIIGTDGERTVVAIGATTKCTEPVLGKTTQLELKTSMRGKAVRYYVDFGGNCWISKTKIEELGLKPGDKLDVVAKNGRIVALVDNRNPENPRSIQFILVYRPNAGILELEQTSSVNVERDDWSGLTVLEHSRTSASTAGDRTRAKGKDIGLLDYVPWETTSMPLACAIEDGERVILFSDSPTFNIEEWQALNLLAKVRSGQITKSIDLPNALFLAGRAVQEFDEGTASILDLTKLQKAYSDLLKAHCADPTNETYLQRAVRAKKSLIAHRRHAERRAKHLESLEQMADKYLTKNERAKKLAGMFARPDMNATAIAYALETLYGLADKTYGSNRMLCKIFQEIFAALPLVFGISSLAATRLLSALRILYHDPDLRFIPEYILSHPPKGKKNIFIRRKTKIQMPQDAAYEIDWEIKRPRKTRPISTKITIDSISSELSYILTIAVQLYDRAERIRHLRRNHLEFDASERQVIESEKERLRKDFRRLKADLWNVSLNGRDEMDRAEHLRQRFNMIDARLTGIAA